MDEEDKPPTSNSLELTKLKNKSNVYSSSQSISQNLLNTSIISLHISILVNTVYYDYYSDGLSSLESTLVILTSISIFAQLLIFFAVVWLYYVKPTTKRGCITAKMVNGWVTGASGLTLVINIAISAVNSKLNG